MDLSLNVLTELLIPHKMAPDDEFTESHIFGVTKQPSLEFMAKTRFIIGS